jgi:hypothetical protein
VTDSQSNGISSEVRTPRVIEFEQEDVDLEVGFLIIDFDVVFTVSIVPSSTQKRFAIVKNHLCTSKLGRLGRSQRHTTPLLLH